MSTRILTIACVWTSLLLSGSSVAQSTGRIVGHVTDKKNNEAVIEASIALMGGNTTPVLSDIDGQFTMTLAPGVYDLRVYYELYKTQRISGVVVEAGKVTPLNVKLEQDGGAVQEVVVEAKAEKATENARLVARKESAVVSDGISAQEIARAPASAASDAVKRVVSASVVDGRYVFVRGLGGRYSTTLLNGVTLPSPEPDQPAVPLDLFPAVLLANLTVAKTYTPDLPGSFSGGTMQIATRAYPEKFTLQLRVGSSGDSVTTFKPTLGNNAQGRSDQINFKNNWEIQNDTAKPNASVSGTLGDTTHLFGHKVGYLASLSYGTRMTTRRAQTAAVRLVDDQVQLRESGRTDSGITSTNLGGLVNVGVELGQHNDVQWLTLITRATDDQSQHNWGYSESDAQDISSQRSQYVSRMLITNQLSGEHRLDDVVLRWQGNVSTVNRHEPDTRDLRQDVLSDGRLRLNTGPGSGERFFSTLNDLTTGAGADATVPIKNVSLKTGALWQHSAREFDARRFRYNFIGNDPSVLFQNSGTIFSNTNVGDSFRLDERTMQGDAYKGDLKLYAAYVMAEAKIIQPLKVIAGGRYEYSVQDLTPGSRYAITSTPEPSTHRSDGHFLPAINAVYALSDTMNLRSAYSYTLTRPQFRELAPFMFFDFARRRAVSGRADLQITTIHNADLRWEMFPGAGSVISAGAFYKHFANPIEQVIVNPAQGDVSFKNVAGADSLGLEFEARGQGKSIASVLSPLHAGVNFTLIRSRVDLGNAQGSQTSATRPLQGQSPYVINGEIGWHFASINGDINAVYNVYGRRISDVGVDKLPNVYEQPVHRLDVSYQQDLPLGFNVRLSAMNILNQSIGFKQGDIYVYRYRPGVGALATLGWSPNS